MTSTTGRRLVTAEDLCAIRVVNDPQVSPDGRYVAFAIRSIDQSQNRYRSTVWVVPLEGGPPRRLTAGPNDTQPRWSPDGRFLAFISDRSGDKQLWVLPVDGGEAWQLTNHEHGVSDPAWSPHGNAIAYLSRGMPRPRGSDAGNAAVPSNVTGDVRVITRLKYRADGEGFIGDHPRHLWIVPFEGPPQRDDVPLPQPRRLTDGDWDDSDPAWSPDGRAIAFSSNRTPDRDINTVSDIWVVTVEPEAEAGTLRKLTGSLGPARTPAWSPDGRMIAYLGHTNPPDTGLATNTQLWCVPADSAEGAQAQCLSQGLDRSLANHILGDLRSAQETVPPRWSPDGRWIYTLVSDRGCCHVVRFSAAGGEIERVVGGERQVYAFDLTPDGRGVVFAASAPLDPSECFVVRRGEGERRLTAVNAAWLAEVQLSVPERLIYRSFDGQEIEGWLLWPPQRDPGRRYPLILYIHGGPHALYGYTFMHEFQYLAARSFVVLYTNPRGSQGYGQSFAACIKHRWGTLDYQDVMAGVEAALSHDGIGPQRLGVAGGSYGGYLTNWIVSHTDRFKAAVTERSVSNLYSFYGTSDIGWYFAGFEVGGTPQENAAAYLERSPITYADRITTPLLILHSEHDLRCPIEQAEQLFVALKHRGRTVEFVRFPDEDHNLSRSGQPRHRLERLRRISEWFERHL